MKTKFNSKGTFPYGRAICYSGFREGQHPGGDYPSYDQVKEDLLILENDWKYLRLYDCDPHGETVLEVIRKERLDFQVLMGAYIAGEVNNPDCPWGGGVYPEEVLKGHIFNNEKQIERLIQLANEYPEIICSSSVGNEACVHWTDHLVPVERVIHYAELLKNNTSQPVTFCENYVPWMDKLKPLGEVLDFISVHTYPVWEYKSIHDALEYTKENYYQVANTYPDKAVVITEAGWTTNSNGHAIHRHHVNEEFQRIYLKQLLEWVDEEQILTYVFEAFDEPWKGSPDPMEPEKHWGLFRLDRSPKLAAVHLEPA